TAPAADEVVVVILHRTRTRLGLAARLNRVGLAGLLEAREGAVHGGEPDRAASGAELLVQLLGAHKPGRLDERRPHRLPLPCVPLRACHTASTDAKLPRPTVARPRTSPK